MRDLNRISQFVEAISYYYSINLNPHIADFNLDGSIIEEDIITEDNYDERIRLLSKILGISVRDIENGNIDVALSLYKKYPFFGLLIRFEKQKQLFLNYSFNKESSLDEASLILAIFGDRKIPKKYNKKDLLERLVLQLKEYDKVLPGTFHPNGKIKQFHHDEEEFIDFPQYSVMMKSFLDIYDRLNFLFFKALDSRLSDEEINEYNLLISFFEGKERAASSYLYYEKLCEHRELYISEHYTRLDSYLRISSYKDFEPWKCNQFVENKEYAQRYQDIFTNTVNSISGFCMRIKNVFCWFKWSDAPYIKYEDYDFLPDELKIGEYQETTRIYIPKTQEELGNDDKLADTLREFACPESKGGLIIKKPEYSMKDEDRLQRMIKYLDWGI